MTNHPLAWRIEEVCFNAYPSLRQVLRGGWLLRFSDGMSRRGNSVNPLGPECRDAEAVITIAEALYRAQQSPAIFRVPSIADPVIDRSLATRRYDAEGESCVLYGDIAAVAATPDATVRLWPSPEEEWLAAMVRLQGHTAERAAIYRSIVSAIAIPTRFALLEVAREPAALAYGALHDGLLCYESVVVDGARRRQGLGWRVIAALAAWGRAEKAEGVCLQVQADNTAARALYTGFGLRELYRYHYRREPLG